MNGGLRQEQELKEKLYQASLNQGLAGCDKIACRPCLRDRIEQQANDAERQGAKARRLFELNELLAKHPDIARILDLLEEVRE